jgi:superfamily II DNA or RNA helicase
LTTLVDEGELSVEALTSTPEPGQLVEVRRRQWIVADIDGSTVANGLPKQHLVRLSSIGEDSLGEEIEVIWEIEPGAHIIERAGLPQITGVDDADTLQAFIDAVRWGAATNADRGYLQAPFRSGVSIEDFQLDPLVRAIEMARTNLLIADDVGLGKTIEAGLIVQEMMIRHRVRTVLILCPASLQEKWRVEMEEKFGLEFRIVDTAEVKRLRREQGLHANPWTSFPRLITSLDWVKQGEGLRLFKDVIPHEVVHPRKFDMLIIDEAHNVTPSVGKYAVETLRTSMVRLIAPHFQHKLFLTATPHNGYTESFTALLELLDDQRFARNVLPDEKKLQQVMIRRLKSELLDEDGKPIYAPRVLDALPVDHTDEEREIRTTLDTYISSREKKSDDDEDRVVGRFVHQLLRKRLASSPAAFATTFEKHVATLEGRAEKKGPRKKIDDRILRRKIAKTHEDYSDDDAREQAEIDALEEANLSARPLTVEEGKLLRSLRDWARSAALRSDTKAEAVMTWLDENLKQGDEWSDRRVILFTEYRTTQTWMQEILATRGYGGDRLQIIHGSMDQEEREVVRAAFQAAPDVSPVRILLATDAASEGIDLQNHCSRIIHLEIPYNPNVMEQRNGRVDRHGQKDDEVLILHPVDARGDRGEDILRTLRKLAAMSADMGSVNPVIAPQFADYLEGRRDSLDLTSAEARIQKSKKYLKIDADLKERVKRAHDRLAETRADLGLSPERIERAVKTALRMEDKPDLKPASLDGVPDGLVFWLPELPGSWARCLDGLQHPYTGKIRPVTFDHDVAKGRDDVVLIHLNHRLVQMSLRLLRAEVWALDHVKRINRVSVKSLPDEVLAEPAVVILSRLVITGGGHHRLHEELTETGGFLRDSGFRREVGVNEVRKWIEHAELSEISGTDFTTMTEKFEKFDEAILKAIKARSRERLKTLETTLGNRKKKEVDDIGSVLTDLEKLLQEELAKEQRPEQLVLQFSDQERLQLKRDTLALEARLARIPSERVQELGAIEVRYEGMMDHTFPVAVVLLCPNSMAIGE